MNKIYSKNPVNLVNPVKNRQGEILCRVLNGQPALPRALSKVMNPGRAFLK